MEIDNKDTELLEFEKLKRDLEIYNTKLLNKQYLIIFPDINNKELKQLLKNNPKNIKKLKAIEIYFKKEYFSHLAGIKKNSLKYSPSIFYDKLLKEEVKLGDYELSVFRNLKTGVFSELPDIFRRICILGKYDYHKEKLDVDKIMGNTKKVPDVVLGLRKKDEKIENSLIERYVPVSLLNAVTEDLSLKGTERRIIFIFEKENTERKYSKLLFKHKDFLLDNIYNTKELFEKLDSKLKDKIRNDIGINIKEEKETKEIKTEESKEKTSQTFNERQETKKEKIEIKEEKTKPEKERPKREKRSRSRENER